MNEGGISLTQYAAGRARKLALRISLAGFLMAAVLVVGGGLVAYYQRLDYAARAVESTVGASIALGDTFQLNKMMSSLSKNEGILAAAVRESQHGKLVAVSGNADLAAEEFTAEFNRRFRIVGSLANPRALLTHSLEANGAVIGTLYIACALPVGFFVMVLGIVAVLFCVASVLIVDAARRTALAVTQPTEILAARIMSSVDQEEWRNLEASDLRFSELLAVQDKVRGLLSHLSATKDLEAKMLKEAVIVRIAAKVRHDVNQALLASSAILKRLAGKPDDLAIMRASLERIESTVNEIPRIKLSDAGSTGEYASPAKVTSPPSEVHLLANLLHPVCGEFRALIADSKKEINLSILMAETDSFVQVNATRFKRMLANLLANAMDAIEDSGSISVCVERTFDSVEVRISDSGCGIPEEILTKIGQAGVSTKPKGSGLGLSSAIEYLKEWNGDLRIESVLGKGTTIHVCLPAAQANPLFISRLVIPANSHVIILDDDPTVHEIWRSRLDPIELKEHGITVSWFFDSRKAEDLIERLKRTGTEFLILADYDLGDGVESGLDVIRRLGVCDRSIMISSCADDAQVIEACRVSSVPLVPKSLQEHIPIQIAA